MSRVCISSIHSGHTDCFNILLIYKISIRLEKGTLEFMIKFLSVFWDFTNSISIYLVAGLFLAGILHEILPDEQIKRHLGSKTFYSIFKAVIFGIPLPLCSCSVIPFISALKKKGANSGAVLAFTIATPITGVDSIFATYGVFGWLFTVLRVVTSTVIAVVAGVVGLFTLKEEEKRETVTCGCCGCSCSVQAEESKKGFSLVGALSYGFKNILSDIAKPLLIGLFVGTLITVLGESYLKTALSSSLFGYTAALLIAVPMYVCATSSIPIAASLILAGAPPGAAFLFLTAGPATNAVSIGVVKETLGKRATAVYLLTVIIGSLLFGLLIDYTFQQFYIDPKSVLRVEETRGLLNTVSSIIILTLCVYYLFKKRWGNG